METENKEWLIIPKKQKGKKYSDNRAYGSMVNSSHQESKILAGIPS
jgi:hypothetical protein